MTFSPPLSKLSFSLHIPRVCPGKCYHLYNGLRASLLDAYQLPEIMRTPLEELCLQIKVVYEEADWQWERQIDIDLGVEMRTRLVWMRFVPGGGGGRGQSCRLEPCVELQPLLPNENEAWMSLADSCPLTLIASLLLCKNLLSFLRLHFFSHPPLFCFLFFKSSYSTQTYNQC